MLTLQQILETRDFIDVDIGEAKIIQGKIVESTPVPTADGYSIVAWAQQVFGWESDPNKVIVKFGNFYPIEVYKERQAERKRKDRFNFDLFLTKFFSDTPIYKLGPKKRDFGGSLIYPGKDNYDEYFQRLTQEERVLK